MRSAAKTFAGLLLMAALQAGALAQDEAPTPEQVQTAVAQVREDPLWAQNKKEHVLRFKPEPKEKAPKTREATNIPGWIETMTEMARNFIWVLGAGGAAWTLVALRRWARVRDQALAPVPNLLPSHVSALDIRPQSLPPQIAEAVLRLWQEGQHRQALSLLYRATLSRLVHQYAVPIKAASTEGECIALADTRLDTERSALVQQLVTAWQRATYGSQLPSSHTLKQLCQGFTLLLDHPNQEARA
jgi:hypothetical protein